MHPRPWMLSRSIFNPQMRGCRRRSSTLLARTLPRPSTLSSNMLLLQVAEFSKKHLKDHVKAFLGDLLKLIDVAMYTAIQTAHERMKEVEDKNKSLLSQVTTSASAANQSETAIKGDISSLYSSKEDLTTQLASLRAEVQSLTGVIKVLSDDVKTGEEEKDLSKERSKNKKEKKKRAKDVSSNETRQSARPSPSATVDQLLHPLHQKPG